MKEGDKSSLLPAPSHPSIGVTLRDGLETCRLLFLLRYTNFDSGVRSSSSPQTAAEHVKFERVIRITNLCAAITVRPRSLPNGVPVVLDRLSRIAVLQSRFHTPIVESPRPRCAFECTFHFPRGAGLRGRFTFKAPLTTPLKGIDVDKG